MARVGQTKREECIEALVEACFDCEQEAVEDVKVV
jgi:hypothetical protein